MEESMYFGTMLMAVGMTTVFTILALVVLGGKLTILITNKLAPVSESVVVRRMSSTSTETSKIAAITAAVESITQGKGKISEIKKS
jgi:oxaloacetate decarboxylase (Na+ extruding) subunit gamma